MSDIEAEYDAILAKRGFHIDQRDQYQNDVRNDFVKLVRKRELEARIAELKQLDSLTYSFMSLGNDLDYSYRQSAVDEHIADLQKRLDLLKEISQ